MEIKRYDKLVRDRIPQIIESSGREAVTETVDRETARNYLAQKLREEAEEYFQSRDPEELADVLEVVYALAAETGVSRETLEAIRVRKANERGAFRERIVLKEVRTP